MYHYTFVVQRKPDGEEEDPENKKQKQESEGGSGDGPGPVQNGHAEVSFTGRCSSLGEFVGW